MVNCAECGKRTLRPERVKKEGVGWVLVCQNCFGKLGKTKEHISPRSPETKTYKRTEKIEKCGDGEYYDKALRKCLPIPARYSTTEQIRRFLKIHQREQVHLPAPQVPAQPVVAVGPITIEQRLDDLERRFTELERNMANVLGLLGVSAA